MTKTFLFLFTLFGTLSAHTTSCHEQYKQCKSKHPNDIKQCQTNLRNCLNGHSQEETPAQEPQQQQIPEVIVSETPAKIEEPKVIVVSPQDKELPCKRSCDRQASKCSEANGVSCSEKWTQCLNACGGPDEPTPPPSEPTSICESKHRDCLNRPYSTLEQCNTEKVKCQNSIVPPELPVPAPTPREELPGKLCNFCTSEYEKCTKSKTSEEEDCYNRRVNCQRKCPTAAENNTPSENL